MTTTLRVICLLVILSITVLNAQSVAISNASFEIVRNDNFTAWNTTSDSLCKVSPDWQIFSSGNVSCNFSHPIPGTTKLYSLPVKLITGQLYKLSGKIKTQNAVTSGTDQYPTPVAACLSMKSFPFTNHSPAIGATHDWQTVAVYFYAVTENDQIVLNFGYNGKAAGKVWFDDIVLEKENDLSKMIDPQTIKQYKKGFRYEDKGWINIHIEGKPFERGMQYGYLVAAEIKEFINKLSIQRQKENPVAAWNNLRTQVDLLFLRKFDEEFLTEMKGIAEGVNTAGVQIFNRQVDLLDIVTLNSEIDLDYAEDAIKKTAHSLSGKTLQSAEGDNELQDRLHKCSGLLATKSATADSRVVFGQLFMWGGYTGPHWNIFVDVVPENGYRLVYQTFPGGIHSGADFYLNAKGIIIGETTVGQTPFNINGTPQSNRIRKAAQYASSVDDVVKIMTTDNNGLYTNDWLIADTKIDEVAILLLGTEKYKLWRSTKNEFYGGQKDWYWSNNNTKDLEVRKEYRVNDNAAPYDLSFRPWDRDVAFYRFYEKNKGKIDAAACMQIWNSSPANRPHACDGKVVTSEMAEKMMFFANYGKVTLREAFVNENGRIPDLPGAIPRLSLGYTTINPVFVADHIKELLEAKSIVNKTAPAAELNDVQAIYSFPKPSLWKNTVYPKADESNWFISGTSAYWNSLNGFSSNTNKNFQQLKDDLTDLNYRYLYTTSREKDFAAINVSTDYSGFGSYYIPRIRGAFVLHQLRLLLGNDLFAKCMQKIHESFREKDITTSDIVSIFEKTTGKDLKGFFSQWLNVEGVPKIKVITETVKKDSLWTVTVKLNQIGKVYHFISTISFEMEKATIVKQVEVTKPEQSFSFDLKSLPIATVFNAGNDIPVEKQFFYTFTNFYDDFANTRIIYGTNSEIEAQHTLALRFSKTLADRFTEKVLPVLKESELTPEEIESHDLVVLGNTSYNCLTEKLAKIYNIRIDKNSFIWQGKTYADSDDGIFLALPNPYNKKHAVYLFSANSSLQLYQMLKSMQRMPGFAIFKSDQIVSKGYIPE